MGATARLESRIAEIELIVPNDSYFPFICRNIYPALSIIGGLAICSLLRSICGFPRAYAGHLAIPRFFCLYRLPRYRLCPELSILHPESLSSSVCPTEEFLEHASDFLRLRSLRRFSLLQPITCLQSIFGVEIRAQML